MESIATETIGTVFNTQRFSLHDGTGIRTLVFMKGCPLRCRWCSNPEGFRPEIQVMNDPSKCIGCGACLNACPKGAIGAAEGFLINRAKCAGCGECVKRCPSNAKTVSGDRKTVDEIVSIVKRDAPFYGHSNGGVTIGGGEMLMQPTFVREVLKRCREEGINTAVETSGHGSWLELSKIAELCDIIHFDIKELDCDRHMYLTGMNNALILENLRRLDALICSLTPMPQLILRLPIVENYNFSEIYLRRVSEFIKTNLKNYHVVELLPFHNFGEQKYRRLDMRYEMEGCKNTDHEELGKYVNIFEEQGIPVRVSNW